MTDWISILDYGFFQRALLAGVLMSLACGLMSPFLVLRGLSFSVDGLAHASLGGLAIGFIIVGKGPSLSVGAYLVAIAFACGVALAIGWLSRRNHLSSDTAVGACYVAAFALGILLLSARRGYVGHLETYLFGNILAMSNLDCWLMGGLAVMIWLIGLGTWRWVWQWTFDEELAKASGVPADAIRYGFLLAIAGLVVLAIKIVGVLLVTALLILPGATATLTARRSALIAVLSVGSASACTVAGLLGSNRWDVPPGPVIVLMAFVLFVVAFLSRQFRDQRRRGSAIIVRRAFPPGGQEGD